jgi:glycosyltransferase involved in cell wall biosynthesis
MENNYNYSIVIPAFNSGNFIDETLKNLIVAASTITSIREIIIVNDGSEDDTWLKMVEFKKKHQGLTLKIINLSRNFGQQNATYCGILKADNNCIITLDDDYLYQSEELKNLIKTHEEEDTDIVYGLIKDLNKSLIKKIGASSWKTIVKVHNKHKRNLGTSIRIFRKTLLTQEINSYAINIDEVLDWSASFKKFILLEKKKSFRKKSSYKSYGLFKEIYNYTFGYSIIPIRYITTLGFGFAGISFIIALNFLIKKFLLKVKVIGFTSLIVSVTFSAGLILIGIGTLAQYIGTIISLQMRKPAFHIKEIIE